MTHWAIADWRRLARPPLLRRLRNISEHLKSGTRYLITHVVIASLIITVYLLSLRQHYRDVLLTQELLSAIRSIAGQVFVSQDNAPAHCARDTVEILRCETPQFINPDMWPANSPDLNPVNYCICGVMQMRVYQAPIRDTRELRQRLVETWAQFQQSTVDDAIKQWRKKTGSVHLCRWALDVTLLAWHSNCQRTQPPLFTATSGTQHNSSFQSHRRLEGNNIHSIRQVSFALHKVVRWHFSVVIGKFIITVTVRFILR